MVLWQKGLTNANAGPIDQTYVEKLMKKASKQASVAIDRAKVKERLALMRERFAATFDRLFKIAYWKWEYLSEGITMPEPKDVIKALETISKMDLALLQTEMDAGIYERKLGTLTVNHVETMDPQQLHPIINAMRNYGFIMPKEKANEYAAIPGGGGQAVSTK